MSSLNHACHLACAGKFYLNASQPLDSGPFVKGEVFSYALSSETWVYQEMNGCHWCMEVLFCPFTAPPDPFLLTFECVARLNASAWGKMQIEKQQPFENPNTRLDDLHNKSTWLLAFFHPEFMPGGIWQLVLSNCSPLCPHKEDDVLRDPWLSPKCLTVSVFSFFFWNIYVTCTLCFCTVVDATIGMFISMTVGMCFFVCLTWIRYLKAGF